MKPSTTPVQRKVVIVGDYSVGKLSLLIYLATGEFDDGAIRRVMYETRVIDLIVNGRPLELSLCNAAPQEYYDRLRPRLYLGAAVIVLAFAIDDPKSFQNITERWHPEIMHFCSIPKVPTILIGCKSDLRERREILMDGSGKTNRITKEQGHTLANQIGAIAYLEFSSKSGDGIADGMKLIGKTAMSWDPRAEPRSKRTCLIF